MNTKKITIASVAALAIVGAAAVLLTRTRSGGDGAETEPAPAPAISTVDSGKKPRAARNGGGAAAENDPALANQNPAAQTAPLNASTAETSREALELMIPQEELAKLTPKQLAAFARLRAALDAGDRKAVIAAAGELVDCPSAAVRKGIVDALGWFGVDTLPELVTYMADDDSEISSEAFDRAMDALAEMSGAEKASFIEQTMLTLTDEGSLDMLAMCLNSDIPNSYVISALQNVINNGGANAVEAAKEEYRFFTGEEYTTPEAAQEWLKENPDAT